MSTRTPEELDRYRDRADSYDRSFSILATGWARRRAVRCLALKRGETVLDVACGTGLAFEALRAGIGESGRLVGIELSADMLELASARVAAQGWSNVELIEARVGNDPIRTADAALFSFTHDVLGDRAAIDRVVAALRSGGRAVAVGIMYPRLRPARPLIRAMARPFVTNVEGLDQPWRLLSERLDVQSVELPQRYASAIYVVTARKRA